MIGYIKRRRDNAHTKAFRIVHAALGNAALEGVVVDERTKRRLIRTIKRHIFWQSLFQKKLD